MPLSPTVTRKCLRVMRQLLSYRVASMFAQPVDPERDECPTYRQVVQTPMDLGTIVQKLNDDAYESVTSWRADVECIWENAFLFNGRQSVVAMLARHLQGVFRENTEFLTDNEQEDWATQMNELCSRIATIRSKAPKHLQTAKHVKKVQDQEAKPKITRTTSAVKKVHKETRAPPRAPPQRTPAPKPQTRAFTEDEIVQLAEEVNNLGDENMEPIIELIQKNEPQLMNEGGEMEIDVNKLKLETLIGLRQLVDSLKKK